MSTNKKKAEQLGMPFGTASNRLKKQLMFKYVKLVGDDICFSCGEEIENVEDLSIEHKEPWFNRDVELFWDLENIAFSHRKCNVPHSYPGPIKLRKVGKMGTVWCNIHKDFLPEEKFYRNRSRWSGFDSTCKDCYESNHRVK